MGLVMCSRAYAHSESGDDPLLGPSGVKGDPQTRRVRQHLGGTVHADAVASPACVDPL